MIKNLKRAQRALLREGLEEEAAKYDFSPTTYYDPNPNPSPSPNPDPDPNPNLPRYVLPTDYGLFVEELKTQEPRPLTLTQALALTLALTLTRSSRIRRREPSGS